MHTDWERFEHNGRTLARRTEREDFDRAPWEEECGHGPVSDWTSRDKAPGEMVLVSDRGSHRFYDFADAVRIAKRDGWDTEPFGTGTRGECAHRAALADFDRLRRWCNGDWCYVGVIVAPVCPCCDEVDEAESVSLWGIENDASDYLEDVSHELADDLPALETCGQE